MSLNFALDEEQRLIKESVRSVFRPFEARKAELLEKIVKRREFPQEVWDAIAEAGYLGCMVPEAYGGTDTGLLSMAFVVEELAKLGFGNAILILTAMDAACIARIGPDAARDKFLPKIATGEYKFAFAVTESNAGSNTFRIETHAEKRGDHYVLNGSKTFITGADVADYILLVVRTTSRKQCIDAGLPKAYGLSILIVDANAKGLTRQIIPTRGIEGMNQYTLFFDDMEVPAENLVGEENQGSLALFKTLNPERILAAATAVGISEYALKIACEYARERRVFKDVPIGKYQGVQHPLADVKIKQEAVRLMAYRAAWAFDNDLNPAETGYYANCAKYLAAELGIQAADTAIETLGGNGFSDDFGVAHLWEVTRLLRTAPISKEMILNYVAEHTLELPRSY